MNKLRVLEAFSGIGTQRMALRNLNIPHEVVGISEIDKYAIKSYMAIHGETNNLGDISKVNVEDIPDHDLFTYSFPCTDISIAGRQDGLSEGSGTRSGLLWECKKVIEGKKPKYLLMENVKNLVGKKFKEEFDKWLEYLEGLGYQNFWQVLNAKDYGVPQNRERVFVVSILGGGKYEFPQQEKKNIKLKDVLQDIVESKYYLSEDIQNRFKRTLDGNFGVIGTTKPEFRTIGQRDLVYGTDGNMGTLVATDYKQPKQIIEPYPTTVNGDAFAITTATSRMTHESNMVKKKATLVFEFDNKENEINVIGRIDIKGHDQIKRVYDIEGISPTLTTMEGGNRQPKVMRDYKIRKLTPLECWRLMGCSDEDFFKAKNDGISDSQLYKQAGNAIVVNVLEALFKELFLATEIAGVKGYYTYDQNLDLNVRTKGV